ncbi:hypothetical protein M011DRAFT_494927 [Sporormia fimetaria CBS 119925]|uniref:Uncharacterized protein n=1 Tax=Sporormia fimetaria CBS 119925 TaxID=1340428 RepID=A0A6A6V953_9PLEO|nr:hypothetical protein M011DRAFT_494927 [Sporormia fimetaria CBS 119925]
MLGLSLMLGLNLASSLKRCATILRWSILTKRYVDLEVFDLLLGVETLTKVMKLMVISIPGLHRLNCMRSVPWFRDARKDATKWTSVLCLLWLLVNLGAQILVASLSLFWPVDPSQGTPLLTYGNVSVADLTTWKQHDRAALPWEMSEGEVEAAYNLMSMEAAWSYGFTATRYPVFAVGDVQRDLSSVAGTPLYAGDGFYEYRFINRNPEHLFTEYLIGSRTVQARAACTRLETKGGYFREESDNLLYVEARYPGGPWKRHHLPEVVDGSITWIAHFTVDCGPRCTSLTVFQNSDIATITHNSLFQCNSTLLPVTGGEQDFTNLNEDERTHIYGTDEWATIAAGSIAWTGTISEQDNYTLNARSYLRGSEWSPYHIVSATEVEKLLARYAIGAVAAFDDHGLRFSVKGQFTKPVLGQQLNVDWIWVLSLLGAICGIQFAALVALLVLANKAIIRDDSFVSLAMLLRPIVNRIGEEGMGLSGEEIKEHPKLKFKRVRYGYREGDKGEPKQVDIFFEGKDTLEGKERWTPGLYN